MHSYSTSLNNLSIIYKQQHLLIVNNKKNSVLLFQTTIVHDEDNITKAIENMIEDYTYDDELDSINEYILFFNTCIY